METLKDIRGMSINCNNTVGVSYYNYDEDKPCIEVGVVKGVNYIKNQICLEDGEPISLKLFEVIVLPNNYKEW